MKLYNNGNVTILYLPCLNDDPAHFNFIILSVQLRNLKGGWVFKEQASTFSKNSNISRLMLMHIFFHVKAMFSFLDNIFPQLQHKLIMFSFVLWTFRMCCIRFILLLEVSVYKEQSFLSEFTSIIWRTSLLLSANFFSHWSHLNSHLYSTGPGPPQWWRCLTELYIFTDVSWG